MKQLNLNFNTKHDAKRFVDNCETKFHTDLEAAIDHVFDDGGTKIVTLSGPTCSGKTTTANTLTRRIREEGMHAVVLSIDDFFLDRADRNNVSGEVPDYDSVKALDLGYLEYFTDRLMKGKSILVPKYDFTATSRVGYTEYIPDSRDIYIFEGIQAVYPEITKMFAHEFRSIFISVEESVAYRGSVLRREDIRLMRRIVRDHKFRGATAEFSFHLWRGVRVNEEENIFPNAGNCDIYINSLLDYEPFIIARHLIPLLDTVPADSIYRDEADELRAKIKPYENDLFEDGMIPADSVFREFIG